MGGARTHLWIAPQLDMWSRVKSQGPASMLAQCTLNSGDPICCTAQADIIGSSFSADSLGKVIGKVTQALQ